MREWFGHATEDQAVFFSHRKGRQLKKHEPVSGSQRIVKPIIDFILTTGVFMVHLLQFKTQLRQGLPHVIQKIFVPMD